MLRQHIEIFLSVAVRLKCWIILREPNAESERWIGKSGYIPKSEICKAKTSDNPSFNYSGLVIDPILFPQAFLDPIKASNKWRDFAPNDILPNQFSRETIGPNAGILKYEGNAIHTDYDLMTIVKATDDLNNCAYTSDSEEASLFFLVEIDINIETGLKMIQHGTEFDWTWDGVGAASRERVLIFGPKRQFFNSISSMPMMENDKWHQ